MEQASNALAVARLKLGMVMTRLNHRVVQNWLASPPNPPAGYPFVAGLIATWIEHGRWEDVAGLAREAWAQTRAMPHRVF
jgi:hypothetical protein